MFILHIRIIQKKLIGKRNCERLRTIIKIRIKTFVWNCTVYSRYFQCPLHCFELQVEREKPHIVRQSEEYLNKRSRSSAQCVSSGELVL